MSGESDLHIILKTLKPALNAGEYVFCHTADLHQIPIEDIFCLFREKEAITVILPRAVADRLNLSYSFVSAWITLTVHSSLESVGLTAAFSKALAEKGISCNVVAAFYHDHIFVPVKDASKTMQVLEAVSKSEKKQNSGL